MSNPIRQHHVPRTYLKNFSFAKGNTSKIYIIDKKSKRVFLSNIENVAVEKNFYTISKLEDKYAWEKYYAKNVEPAMNNAISFLVNQCSNSLIQDNALILKPILRWNLSVIMSYQFLRSKQTMEYIKLICEKAYPEIYDDVREKVDADIIIANEELEKIGKDEDVRKMSAMDVILDVDRIKKFCSYFLNRIWIIYKIVGNKEFITSDNPIMFMDSETLNVTPFQNGLAYDNTVIYYPISSKLMLALYSKRKYYLLNLKNSSYDSKMSIIGDKSKNFIDIINKKQIEQCYRQAFSHSEEILMKIK